MHAKRKPERKIFRRILSITFALIFLVTGVSPGDVAAPPPGDLPFETVELPPEAQQAHLELAVDKTSDLRLDSALASVSASAELSVAEGLARAGALNLRILGERVQVQITVEASKLKQVQSALAKLGGEATGVSLDGTLIQGWLPMAALKGASELNGVRMVRRPAEVVLLEDLSVGTSTTQGVAAINGPAWYAMGYTGTGVKIGVIDAGFMGYTGLLGTDLPASVTIGNFVDGELPVQVDGTTPHGTACAEIIYDIAYGADMYLAKVGTNIDLQEAVLWLKDTHHVDIISTSFGWYNVTPGDGTGEFADLVALARADGIFWATAAGNDRESHWGGPFNNHGDDSHDFVTGQNVNYFGPGDGTAYIIPSGFSLSVFLRWDDWTNVDQDYDLYLMRWSTSKSIWEFYAMSAHVQDGTPGQRPTERISDYTSGDATSYGVYISRYDSTRNVNFELFSPDAPLDERVHERSLANLADAPDAITVAALDVTSPYPHELYSSEGPTNGPGGTTGGGSVKPDISGFANVDTEAYGSGVFKGTSAATPHVAGAAALVMRGWPDFEVNDVETYLESNAFDMGTAGLDTVYGYGRLLLGSPPWRRTPVDFDYDYISEVVIFRDGAWQFFDYPTASFDHGVWTGTSSGCIPAPLDYDGDGEVEPSKLCDGTWHFYNDDGTYNKGIWTGGVAGDLPVPADYNGDGTDDVVVWRAGAWRFFDFASETFDHGVWTGSPAHWLGGTSMPVPMDYDGDRAAEFTVWSGGPWHFYNEDGSYNKSIWTGGVAGDLPVPADYNNDGIEEVVVWRAGAWRFFDFETALFDYGVWTGMPPHWTGGTSLPAPLDFDGDWEVDFTVWSGGPWHFYNDDGTYAKGIWTGGVVGDLAISRRQLP